MDKVYFVSGIDTGIGKTVVTGLMARSLRAAGIDAITVKMVQTGNVGFSEDLDAHRRMCDGARFPEDDAGLTAPQVFRFPASPALAARLEGKSVDLARISEAVEACASAHDVVLVEGAGGLDVPLTDDVLAVDFAAERDWPLGLVTCGRLGSVNHTLLSLEAARARGMYVAGIAFNWWPDADAAIEEDAEREIVRRAGAGGRVPPLVRIPRTRPEGPYPTLDFSEFFA